MTSINADLHSHSRVSDGTLAPAELARRAHDNGVALWALTDHDELDGLEEAALAANRLGLRFVPGIEISVSFCDETIHIVGLGIDPRNAALRAGIARTRGGRTARAKQMADSLERAGLKGAFNGALAYASNPDMIARTHFARWLVETGVCSDTGSVFRRFLTDGKPGFVHHRWANLRDAVRWITGAGGVAVIAHPGRYARLSAVEEYALFSEFKLQGGAGVEVLTGSHSPAAVHKYAAMATEFGLCASRGSDFHSPGESRVDLGRLPDLPSTLRPVWTLLPQAAELLREAACTH